MQWPALRDHLVSAAATAALLGGGASVLTNKIDLAVLDGRVARLEELNTNVEALRKDMQATREELIRSQMKDDRK